MRWRRHWACLHTVDRLHHRAHGSMTSMCGSQTSILASALPEASKKRATVLRWRPMGGMLKNFARTVASVRVAASFLVACGSGSGSDGGPGELNGARAQSYTLSCTESSCDSCRDDADDRYSECLRLCSDPYAPSDCFSQCPSIGDSSCPYACGANERCEEWKADLPLPERDESFFAACTQFGRTCTEAGEKFVDARCDQEARLQQPQFADEYACVTDHACDRDGAAHCRTTLKPGTMGTALCKRAKSCGEPCRPADEKYMSDEEFINSLEGKLRPSLVDVAMRCAAEKECAKFAACRKALDHLWWLDEYNYLQD